MLRDAKIVGKVVLSDEQHYFLIKNNIDYIAKTNPSNVNYENEIIDRIGDAKAIIVNISTKISKNVINQCENLRFIQTWSTGLDNIDLIAARENNILVKNVEDFSIQSVAEKTLGLMLMLANRFIEANESAKKGEWRYTDFPGTELRGKTLTVVGIGRIGKRIVELATAFGMNTLKINSKTTKNELHDYFSVSDFLSINCPLTTTTNGLIGEEEFLHLKKGCIVINTSRGGVVIEEALINALDNGIIKFAAVDVLEQEPPEVSNPLLTHKNVFVTPHCAWHTSESVERLTAQCIENLVNFFKSVSD